MLEGLDLSPRMAVRVAVPLDPPIRRVVWAAMVVLWWLFGPSCLEGQKMILHHRR